jgi:hypothetical protein
MLFHIYWQFKENNSEEDQKRVLELLKAWKPPAEAEFKGFYALADNSGGVAIVEIDSAATLARTTAPFTAWMKFTTTPIVTVEEAMGINGEAHAFRATVQ